MAIEGLVPWKLVFECLTIWPLDWLRREDAKRSRMSGCEGLTGNARTDRALVALARLLGEISSTASSIDAQVDSWISPTTSLAQPNTTKESGMYAKARMPASRNPHDASALLQLQPPPNRTLNQRREGDK
jgi:hypothetical protein